MRGLPRVDVERDAEWRSRLTELQYNVTRKAGTERPNTGEYNLEDRAGDYHAYAADTCCSPPR